VSSKTPRCRLVAFVLTILVTVVSGSASALEPRRSGQENSLTRAFYAAGNLWLLSDAGELSSIRDGTDSRIEEMLPEPALDLCMQDGHPVVITCQREHCTNWTERRRIDGTWRVENTIQTQGDDLIGLSCTPERITLLTSRRLIDSGKEKQASVVLSDELSPDLLVSMLDTPDRVLVGANEGEWGGGLWSIDRHTGKVAPIRATRNRLSLRRAAQRQLRSSQWNSIRTLEAPMRCRHHWAGTFHAAWTHRRGLWR